MTNKLPRTMRAIVLDQFGGPENLTVQTIPVPELEADEVLIRLAYAGVGEWDPFEREGGYAQMLGLEPVFPYVLGSEGSGTVAAVGEGVDDFRIGDEVYASAFLNPKGGMYAEYAVVNASLVSRIPRGLTIEQAGAMPGVGLTALHHSIFEVCGYNGEPDADILQRLNGWIERGPFQVHIARTFPLEQAAEAHRALEEHYLGKLMLQVKG